LVKPGQRETFCLFLVLGGGAAMAASGLVGAKVNLGTLGTVPTAQTANTAADANALQGEAASAFAPSTVIRSASVFGNTGLYCFGGLNPAPRTAVAQLAFEAINESEIFVQVNPTVGGCAGSQIAVATEKKGGGFIDDPFEMIVH
jgi:hypothetical protein